MLKTFACIAQNMYLYQCGTIGLKATNHQYHHRLYLNVCC